MMTRLLLARPHHRRRRSSSSSCLSVNKYFDGANRRNQTQPRLNLAQGQQSQELLVCPRQLLASRRPRRSRRRRRRSLVVKSNLYAQDRSTVVAVVVVGRIPICIVKVKTSVILYLTPPLSLHHLLAPPYPVLRGSIAIELHCLSLLAAPSTAVSVSGVAVVLVRGGVVAGPSL